MKTYRKNAGLGHLVVSVFVSMCVVSTVCAGEVAGVTRSASEKKMSRNNNIIFGVVMDMTPDIDEVTSTLTQTNEIVTGRILAYGERSNVVVVLHGPSIRRETVTDSKGEFRFDNLPDGVFEVCAAAPSRPSRIGTKEMATGKMRFILPTDDGQWARLEIHSDPVTVRGTIRTVDGIPIAGAKVTGTPIHVQQLGVSIPNSKSDHKYRVETLSNIDGSYELCGFIPPNIFSVAQYLGGSDFSRDYASVEIQAEAKGFALSRGGEKTVPLVTEESIVAARRLLKQLVRNSKYLSEQEKMQYRERGNLPSSKGNIITGIDVVMEKTQSDKR